MISNVSCTPSSPYDDSFPLAGAGKRRKLAVVLFNLGGPDSPAAIRPFLLNLFKDPAILRVPFFVRPILARIIAKARVKPASENYALLGGKSPLLELTQEQAHTLEQALPEFEARCFIAMRYWHPFAHETVREVKDWDPDEIILLPLYPQYSTTTTGSSLTDWREAAAASGLAKQTFSLCCYHSDRDFASATAALVRKAYDEARHTLPDDVPLRLLFSAHGLPEVIVKKGDPYQFQVERSTAAVLRAMNMPGLDHQICYQSRATPQVWLGPSTEEAIDRAVEDGVAVLVVPIAFVSEHSETLVELDVEYAELAHGKNIKGYFRVPTQNSDPGFIGSLAGLVRRVREHGPGLCSFAGSRVCPRIHRDCPHGEQEDAA
ncbi:ferrochelatase [Granulibacter bethesdensis]|nr:ferrochelatase [Granulibacter bethesdensis]